MDKRTFLKASSLLSLSAVIQPFWACTSTPKSSKQAASEFSLPPLPFEAGALEPHFDKMTMEIHHGRHHAAYINNLNSAIKNTAFATMSIEQIMRSITDKDTALRNNGGGHYNHTLFWSVLSPKSSAPSRKLASAIGTTFGSVEQFRTAFTEAAKGIFGSGWVWLCVGQDKKLFLSTTPNQDNPLMNNIVKQVGTPIMGLDVWEHAYYLKYQNKRADYIEAFWKVLNWDEVSKRYDQLT